MGFYLQLCHCCCWHLLRAWVSHSGSPVWYGPRIQISIKRLGVDDKLIGLRFALISNFHLCVGRCFFLHSGATLHLENNWTIIHQNRLSEGLLCIKYQIPSQCRKLYIPSPDWQDTTCIYFLAHGCHTCRYLFNVFKDHKHLSLNLLLHHLAEEG